VPTPLDARAVQLCDAILRHPGVAAGDDAVTLDGGTEWPTLHSPVLFVRHFYGAFYSGVLGHCGGSRDDGGKAVRKFIVTGTPGIGKSAFGLYALFRALRDGRVVVYDARHLEGGFVFHPNGAVWPFLHANRGVLAGLLGDPDTVHISDGIEPAHNAALTLFIAPPHAAWACGFADSVDCLPPCVFPAYTQAELLQLAAAAFPDVLRDDGDDGGAAGIRERYGVWGGVPRYVLAKRTSMAQAELELALSATVLSADTLRQAPTSPSDLMHTLLHLKARGESEAAADATSLAPSSPWYYQLAGAAFGSRHIAERVAARLDGTGVMEEFVAGAAREPLLAALRGAFLRHLARRPTPLTRQ
jgi:hypothetical protein